MFSHTLQRKQRWRKLERQIYHGRCFTFDSCKQDFTPRRDRAAKPFVLCPCFVSFGWFHICWFHCFLRLICCCFESFLGQEGRANQWKREGKAACGLALQKWMGCFCRTGNVCSFLLLTGFHFDSALFTCDTCQASLCRHTKGRLSFIRS